MLFQQKMVDFPKFLSPYCRPWRRNGTFRRSQGQLRRFRKGAGHHGGLRKRGRAAMVFWRVEFPGKMKKQNFYMIGKFGDI